MAARQSSLRGPTPCPNSTGPDIHTGILQQLTESHALAVTEPDEKGAAQVEHDNDVVDLGWDEDPENIASLVGGMSNEDIWLLVRRFNKVWLQPSCCKLD